MLVAVMGLRRPKTTTTITVDHTHTCVCVILLSVVGTNIGYNLNVMHLLN
jgi:hypothetical protein